MQWNNLKCIFFMVGFVSVYLVQYKTRQFSFTDKDFKFYELPKEYLVYNPQCRMPNLNPFSKDVMSLIKKQKPLSCSNIQPLTEIEQNFNLTTAKLIFKEKYLIKYLKKDQNIKCYYQEVMRSGSKETADDKFSLSKAEYFNESLTLPSHVEFIIVTCKALSVANVNQTVVVYKNAHEIIQKFERTDKLERYKKLYPDKKPLSVLMVGIDSISRLNLIRTMPLTHEYLNSSGWFDLRGYNKVDDNTFPNLMAILTGYNRTITSNECNPKKLGSFNECPFIWNYFRDNGYVTGYAEDEAAMSTFNLNKAGFLEKPVDHYFRYFGLALEKNLKKTYKHGMISCLGYQSYADYIYQYATDFATTYKDESFFGLFWMNTFSHNDINDPSVMDQKSKDYLLKLDKNGVLNTSMVIFFSDHGIRFGPVMELYTGFIEERLPFIYIWLPEWFKEKHPLLVKNLNINRDRLTNPYDLHMTLKHILELSGRIDNLPNAKSCPKCQSLLYEVPWDRSCEEVNINSHWCTCVPHLVYNKTDQKIKRAVEFQLNYINEDIAKRTVPKNLCAKLSLKTIMSARKAVKLTESDEYNDFMVSFKVSPSEAKFQATLRHHIKNDTFERRGTVSRLNLYGTQSYCVDTDYLKKYCYCTKKKGKRKH